MVQIGKLCSARSVISGINKLSVLSWVDGKSEHRADIVHRIRWAAARLPGKTEQSGGVVLWTMNDSQPRFDPPHRGGGGVCGWGGGAAMG